MTENNRSQREIDLGKDFGDFALKVNGATVKVHADGSVTAHTQGDVDIYTAGAVRVHSPVNESSAKAKTALQIGDEMPDGTIYAGISPETQRPMYATPRDALGVYSFNEAAMYASKLDAHGHHDFRVPGKRELLALFGNRNNGKLKGTFNEISAHHVGWYWSSLPDLKTYGWAQGFSDGNQHYLKTDNSFSLRCVRG